ncbi:hypothetical protein FRC08_000869 [Ceratobasidium sp. 394]|nr:hypothetical protein FRC08_000869 [Ceratobasidium sp. 394]
MLNSLQFEIPAECVKRLLWNVLAGGVGDRPYNLDIPEADLLVAMMEVEEEEDADMGLPQQAAGPSSGPVVAEAAGPHMGETSSLLLTPTTIPRSDLRSTPSLAATESMTEWQGLRFSND